MTPRASFVIPAYNVDRWISKTIYSCRNQTIKQVEIIVVNDGSTDATKAIIDWHAKEDPRVIPVHLEKNVGRSEARNIGNAKASSEYILVLDGDDMAARNRVKDTIATFQLKGAHLVYGSFFVIDSLGNVQENGKIPCAPFNAEMAKKQKLNFICHSTMAYTKALAEKVKYESGEFARLGMDDWRFQWEAHQKGYKFAHIKSPLAYYRMTEDGISAQRNPEEVEKLKVEYLASI